MALEDFSEYPSPRMKNGVIFLTPLYVLIATKFSVATCFSEFAFYRRFFENIDAKKGPKKWVKMPNFLYLEPILRFSNYLFT